MRRWINYILGVIALSSAVIANEEQISIIDEDQIGRFFSADWIIDQDITVERMHFLSSEWKRESENQDKYPSYPGRLYLLKNNTKHNVCFPEEVLRRPNKVFYSDGVAIWNFYNKATDFVVVDKKGRRVGKSYQTFKHEFPATRVVLIPKRGLSFAPISSKKDALHEGLIDIAGEYFLIHVIYAGRCDRIDFNFKYDFLDRFLRDAFAWDNYDWEVKNGSSSLFRNYGGVLFWDAKKISVTAEDIAKAKEARANE